MRLAANLPTEGDVSRVIEMAWEDRTPFEAIERQFGLNESAVVALMRSELKRSSFKMWRKRMNARVTKHGVMFSNPGREPRAPKDNRETDEPQV